MKRLLIAMSAGVMLVLFGCSDELPTGTDSHTAAMNPSQAVAPNADHPANGMPDLSITYEVTVENLTPATGAGSSQPLSPPVMATHRRSMHVFQTGKYASEALAQVAEDAVNGPLVSMLESSDRVHAVATGSAPIPPGASATFEIDAAPGMHFLSLVSMLVNTNDGFTGLDAARLPVHCEASWDVYAWDAGSEQNTELESDIPGPCCGSPGVGPDEHEPISMHPGILGVGDLAPSLYDWNGAAARITVKRMN